MTRRTRRGGGPAAAAAVSSERPSHSVTVAGTSGRALLPPAAGRRARAIRIMQYFKFICICPSARVAIRNRHVANGPVGPTGRFQPAGPDRRTEDKMGLCLSTIGTQFIS